MRQSGKNYIGLLGHFYRFQIFQHQITTSPQTRKDVRDSFAGALFRSQAGHGHFRVTVENAEQFQSGISTGSDNGDIQHD